MRHGSIPHSGSKRFAEGSIAIEEHLPLIREVTKECPFRDPRLGSDLGSCRLLVTAFAEQLEWPIKGAFERRHYFVA